MTENVVTTPSTNLKNAIRWLGEVMQEHPEKNRTSVLREAELRFDLTPAECCFLDQNFDQVLKKAEG